MVTGDSFGVRILTLPALISSVGSIASIGCDTCLDTMCCPLRCSPGDCSVGVFCSIGCGTGSSAMCCPSRCSPRGCSIGIFAQSAVVQAAAVI